MGYFLILLPLGMLLLVHLYLQYSRKGKLINRLAGPAALPILGNGLQLAVSPAELYKLLRKWGNAYYPIYRMWLVHKPIISIRHPDDLEILFTSKNHINKNFGYDVMYPWLHTGLLTSSGEKWHHRRKILTSAFHFNILKRHMEIINEQTENTIAHTRNKGSQTNVDVVPFCLKYALYVICESSMGVVLNSETNKETTVKYKEALADMTNMIIYRLLRPYVQDWVLPLLSNINKKIKNSIHEIDRFTNEIVQQRRKYYNTNYQNLDKLQNDAEQLDNDYYGSQKKRLAMLDLLLSAEKDNLIDHEGIKEEVSTFIFAGHDTTAMSLSFTLLVLAEHEDIQDRARKEVEEIFNQKNGPLDLSDLKNMTYLERVIKESLRLYPSVPTIIRHMTEDLQLKNCLAPRGCDVIMHVVDVHRDPNFWPNPEKFDPDRFLPEAVNKRHPFAYVPFSAGSRNCIGQKFAMMELKTFFASILYNFYLKPIDRICDFELVADVITRPSRPVQTKFIRIDRH